MAILTNCLIDGIGEECSGGEGALNTTLMNIFTSPGGIFAFCQTYPNLRCFISPPNIRNRPHWYPRFRPIILRQLQHIMLSRPPNLQLLEDHPGLLDRCRLSDPCKNEKQVKKLHSDVENISFPETYNKKV